MASKADRFYYENFVQAAAHSCKAADYLVECLANYDPEGIEPMVQRMHEIEHEADKKKHEMSAQLARAFVTPFDREDLALLSQCVDEVTDKIEEILQRFYVDEIRSVTADGLKMSQKIAECCRLTKAILEELHNFRKSESLRDLIIDVNRAEEECDLLYLQSTLRVRKEISDVLEIVAWRQIYDCMEDCADACEHVADTVDMIVMKNT